LALWFGVVVNVNLAIMNLLPLPILDGGHITLAVLEKIRRRPINTRFLEYLQTAFALLLLSFMAYVTVLDVGDRAKPAKSGDAEPAIVFPQ
jgi:regulator of sigma E protease